MPHAAPDLTGTWSGTLEDLHAWYAPQRATLEVLPEGTALLRTPDGMDTARVAVDPKRPGRALLRFASLPAATPRIHGIPEFAAGRTLEVAVTGDRITGWLERNNEVSGTVELVRDPAPSPPGPLPWHRSRRSFFLAAMVGLGLAIVLDGVAPRGPFTQIGWALFLGAGLRGLVADLRRVALRRRIRRDHPARTLDDRLRHALDSARR